jgi:peptide/nickel transport system permease protein
MLRYIAQRVMLMVPTLLGVALLVFFMLRVMPGDIVELKLKADGAAVSQEVLDVERARLGLDKPLYIQLVTWLGGMVVGDMGTSMWTGQSVSYEIAIRLELSLQVAFMATLIAVCIAVPLGTLAALFKDTWIDYVVRVLAIAGLAVPSFWLGMMLILTLLVVFTWLPPITFTSFYKDPVANLSQLIWPALAVGYRYSAVATRMTRSALLEVLREDYIRTARAKGVFERLVVARHAMRNAILPVITVIGLEFAFLIGGLVVTEQVFNLNGVGKLFVQAVTRGDYTLIQGLVMLVATIAVFMNLLVDLLYAVFDPRIRYAAR